ncbi:MAG: YggS family pyridoxal phosphate-dependent enzyme [Synergistaceae bacterium]
MVEEIKENIKQIRKHITEIAKKSGRDPEEIKLMGVSKYHPIEKMILASSEVNLLGENKIQEASEKREKWPKENKTPWHLIGHLQRNKARKALEIFDLIESVDSLELAQTLNRILKETNRTQYPIYIEVNTSGEENKSGIPPQEMEGLAEYILEKCPLLKIQGLMTIGPNSDDTEKIRKSFSDLREMKKELEKKHDIKIPELSMGMSGDYPIAIEEGSTLIRVGTAIFGQREYN